MHVLCWPNKPGSRLIQDLPERRPGGSNLEFSLFGQQSICNPQHFLGSEDCMQLEIENLAQNLKVLLQEFSSKLLSGTKTIKFCFKFSSPSLSLIVATTIYLLRHTGCRSEGSDSRSLFRDWWDHQSRRATRSPKPCTRTPGRKWEKGPRSCGRPNQFLL